MKQEHIVEDGNAVRLDRYLRRIFPHITQGIIEKAIRKKDITVNGERSTASQRLNDGDVIKYFAILTSNPVGDVDDESARSTSYSSNVISLAKKIIDDYLIYESAEFIAINKPAGLAVQGGSKIHLSIDHALQYLNDVQGAKYKLVHRLDKGTSGVLLIAKGYQSAAKLAGAFEERKITKIYLAKLAGIPSDPVGRVDNYIGKLARNVDSGEPQQGNELMQIVDSNNGKRAITKYKIISIDAGKQTALVEFYPETGRTHQLRVHSKHLACPIIGDPKYGGPKAERLMLHAKRVIIVRELFGKEISIEINPDWKS